MITGGIRKIYLLEGKRLVRPGARTLARAFVPAEESGVVSTSEKVLARVDDWMVSKARSSRFARRLLSRRPGGLLLLSEKIDPKLRLEIAKAGVASETKGFWNRFLGLFRSRRYQVRNGEVQPAMAETAGRILQAFRGSEGKLERFLGDLYGAGGFAARDNARQALKAFKAMVSTVGGVKGGPELDALIRQVLTVPGKVPLPPGARVDFLNRQIAELRVSLMLGQPGSLGQVAKVRGLLGVRQDVRALTERMGMSRSGEELAAHLRRSMPRTPDAAQQAVLEDLAGRMDKLFLAARQAF